jgi:hypothetical protein
MGITFTKSNGSNGVIDAVTRAQSDVHAAQNDLRATQDAEVARVISNARADAANYQMATNLVQTTDSLTGNRMWQVKQPTKS